jgi:hypothetical protein
MEGFSGHLESRICLMVTVPSDTMVADVSSEALVNLAVEKAQAIGVSVCIGQLIPVVERGLWRFRVKHAAIFEEEAGGRLL